MGECQWDVGFHKKKWLGGPAEEVWEIFGPINLVNVLQTTSGCTNPTNLSDTVFVDTEEKISLMGLDAPAKVSVLQKGGKLYLIQEAIS